MTTSHTLVRLLSPLAITLITLMVTLGAAPQAAAQGDMPEAASLFEAHIEAIGGREAMEAHRNRVVYGTIEFANGETQVLIVRQEAPNKLRYSAQSPGRFTIVRVYDGTIAWGIDADGKSKVLDPKSDEAKDLAFNAVFMGDAAYKTQYTSMRTTEQTIFDDKSVYAVDVVSTAGVSQRVFFDVESKLIAGKTQVVGTGGTPTELVFHYDEYTEYEGVKLVSSQRQALRGQTNTVRTDFVEVNVDDLPSFSPPEGLTASAGG